VICPSSQAGRLRQINATGKSPRLREKLSSEKQLLTLHGDSRGNFGAHPTGRANARPMTSSDANPESIVPQEYWEKWIPVSRMLSLS
jgi:hypothetical protein